MVGSKRMDLHYLYGTQPVIYSPVWPC